MKMEDMDKANELINEIRKLEKEIETMKNRKFKKIQIIEKNFSEKLNELEAELKRKQKEFEEL